jgi:peptidoglycan/xylan/chitin deacetylase (PgdA/CDA1 family)
VPAVPVLVTTSWDDSHQLDEKLAQEFDDHGLEATFCIAPRPAEISAIQRLTGAALGNIATRFEIGSHTLTHPHPQARVASGVCHLGGHSWEIETHGGWARLRERTGGAAGRGAER